MIGYGTFVDTVTREALGITDDQFAYACRPVVERWLLRCRDNKMAMTKYTLKAKLKWCKCCGVKFKCVY